MAQVVKYTATKLVGTGKRGILKPDASGYYTMPVGGLNVHNSCNEYYTLEGAQHLFESSSAFMRRVQAGCLKGELGHPKKAPGMSDDLYMRRILTIEESNVCCHFRTIWLDHDYGKNNPSYGNPNLVAIMAELKPAGPHGEQLKLSLDNPDEDVCFSIRALTKDYFVRAKTYRVLNTIVTMDNVTEPGIHISRKFNAPGLESLTNDLIGHRSLKDLISKRSSDYALESTVNLAEEALNNMERVEAFKSPSIITKW